MKMANFFTITNRLERKIIKITSKLFSSNSFDHVYISNLNIEKYEENFKKLAQIKFTDYKNGNLLFDPNLSDQCCQIRACWYTNFINKYGYLDKLHEKELLKFGLGITISECSIIQLNCLNRIDKWKEVEKSDLEMILNEAISNKNFEKLYVSIKCEFSRMVNKEIFDILQKNSKIEILPDLLKHLSGQYFFTQKHKRLPFIPIFSAGYILIELIDILKLPVILVYSHYNVKDNHVMLSGVTKFQIKDNKLFDVIDISQDTKCVVIESYSINFIDKNNNYILSFYKNTEFFKVINKMKEEFDFKKSVLCSEALHNKYHQKPNIIIDSKIIDYEYDDLSKEYIETYENYKNLGKHLGYGVNHWNPSGNVYLKDNIPFDMFHIYSSSLSHLNKLLKNDDKIINCKKKLSSLKPIHIESNYDFIENTFYY